MRDERLRVEKNVWALKSDLEILSTRRDDATRRDRRREREEGALAARRDALAEEVLREEERLGQATAAKEAIEAEVGKTWPEHWALFGGAEVPRTVGNAPASMLYLLSTALCMCFPGKHV